jgi:acyl-CoA oxidase
MSRPEQYAEAVRKAVHYMKQARTGKFDSPADAHWYRNALLPNAILPMGIHEGMFVPFMEGHSSKEQRAVWMPRIDRYEVIGTYAQTELGHGTNLKALETTATYDPEHEQFIIHSPTLTSIKWWPGGLGKTSNYAVVMANLIIKGENYGMHPFIVQLRTLEDHSVLPGIEVGDIGPKFGFNTIDNGYLKFDHVRIPREHLLMKNAVVEPDGTYKRIAKSEKAAYSTMIFVRAMIVLEVATRGLAQACTIAIRYSCVRRQSELVPGGPEPKILDFQTQQYKLLPILASCYAYWFSGLYIRLTYFQINYEIQQGNIDLLPELHAVSSGLKAFTTYGANLGIEQCRLACGGHGFSQASGLPKIYTTTTPGCTYEGENSVLYLQVARYLMKNYVQAEKGEKTTNSVSYLSEKQLGKCVLNNTLSPEALIAAYKHRAARLVRKAGSRVNELEASGKPYHEAWNFTSVQFTKAAEAHIHYFIVQKFVDTLEEVEDEPEMHRVLLQLFKLYACYGITNYAAEFIEDGFMSQEQLDIVRHSVMTLMADIRPNAVALVDAFDYPDHLLGSVLGRYDGNVYENLYKWAKESPLNQTEVHESYEKYLKPFMTGKSNL